MRIFIPAGEVVTLLNLIEIDTPSDICLIVRIPLLAGGAQSGVESLINAVRQTGGTAEVVQ